MIHFDILSAYILAIIALIATPGPVVALVLKNTLKGQDSKTNKSVKNAFFTICGTNLGSLILIAISIAVILGVAKVSHLGISVVSLLGSCFIFYLGFSSLLEFFKQRKCDRTSFKHADSNRDTHKTSQNQYSKKRTSSTTAEISLGDFQGCADIETRSYLSGSAAVSISNSLKISKEMTQKSKQYFLQGLLLSLSNPKDILFFIAFFPQFLGITHSIYLSITILTLSWIALDFSLLFLMSYIFQRIQLERLQTLITLFSDVVLVVVGIFGIMYGFLSLIP